MTPGTTLYPLISTLYNPCELSGLCAAGEAADGLTVGIGRSEAIGQPAAVMMEQEAVHFLFVVGRQPGARIHRYALCFRARRIAE